MAGEEKWHVSRTVQPALIGLLLLQLAGIIWWGGKLDSAVTALREWQVSHQAQSAHNGQKDLNVELVATMTALKVEQRNTTKAVDRMSVQIDRLVQFMANEDERR